MTYIIQGFLVSMYETWSEFEWPGMLMQIVAIGILILELVQMSFNPIGYALSPQNYMDLVGNILVLLVARYPENF